MRRVIFIHIPRTAGMSIREYAEQNHVSKVLRDWIPVRADTSADFITIPHLSVRSVIKHGFLDSKIWNDSFKFAFVRNPWDRLVSSWKFYKSFRGSQDLSTGFLVTFRAFIEEVIVKRNWIPPLEFKVMRPYFQQVLPQTCWLEREVDFIGRFESLNEDWKTVCKISGMKHKVLPHKNRSSHKSYQTYYTKSTRNIVGEFYTEEITRFGYKF